MADCPSCGKVFCSKCEKSYHGPNDDCDADSPFDSNSYGSTRIVINFGIKSGIDEMTWKFLNSLIGGVQKDDDPLKARRRLDSIVDKIFADLNGKSNMAQLRKDYYSNSHQRQQMNNKYGEPFVKYFMSQVKNRFKCQSYVMC